MKQHIFAVPAVAFAAAALLAAPMPGLAAHRHTLRRHKTVGSHRVLKHTPIKYAVHKPTQKSLTPPPPPLSVAPAVQ